MNIFCIYWKGDFRGRDFKPSDVWRLYSNISGFLKVDYSFYVLTNEPDANLPGEVIPLKYDWPGWWAKMELHRPDLPKGLSLYLDLDTTIVRDMTPLIKAHTSFTRAEEHDRIPLVMFPNKARKKPSRDGKVQVFRYQAACMMFHSNSEPNQEMWEKFMTNPDKWMGKYRSEQDLMGLWIPDEPVFPERWMMKLAEFKDRVLYDDTIIVTGQPKRMDFRNPKIRRK